MTASRRSAAHQHFCCKRGHFAILPSYPRSDCASGGLSSRRHASNARRWLQVREFGPRACRGVDRQHPRCVSSIQEVVGEEPSGSSGAMWQGTPADAGQSANRPKRTAIALPGMRARPRRSLSPPTWERCVRICMATRVGRAGACEQEHNYRVHPDSAGAGSYPRSAARRIAPVCTRLHSGFNSLELRTA